MDHINGIEGRGAAAFYRTSDRKAPHNAYTGGDGIRDALEALGYAKEYPETYSGHYRFSAEGSPAILEDGFAAEIVKPGYPLNDPWFEYNEEDGLFYRYQYGDPHVDAAFDNTQLAFKNVLVQFAYYEVRDDNGYLAFQVHDDTKDGYYFTNGKGIHVTWEKTADYEPTRFYDDNGNEIELNTGKTMICIVEDGDEFGYD